MTKQTHLFDQFAMAEPLKVCEPREGFTHCSSCHGSGVQFDPKRCCDDCRGLGQVLRPAE